MSTGAQTTPKGGETPEESVEGAGEAPEHAAEQPFAFDSAAQGGDATSGPAPVEGELVDPDGASDGAPDGLEGSEPGDPPDGPLDAEGALAQRLSDAEARADENWDRLLRLQAEMENQRKRAQRDVTAARKFALEGIVGDLLPIRDSLEMGLSAAAEEGATIDSIREGSELTLKMIAAALEKHNIVAIDPVGEKFNPEFHQAMSMQPVEGAAPNSVVSVMQKGYTLNDRLIRPALVMVAK